MISEGHAYHGVEDMEEQRSSRNGCQEAEQREKTSAGLPLSVFLFYSIQASSPLDGAVYIEDRSFSLS
jgi:hypothetical protein